MINFDSQKKYLIAGFLFVLSLIILASPGKTTAQATKSYDSVWQASKLLIASADACTIPSPTTPQPPEFRGKLAIGVSQWKVTGKLTDGTYFREIWSVPETKPEFPIVDCGAAEAKINYGRLPGTKGEGWLASITRNPSDERQYYFRLSEEAVENVIKPDTAGLVYKNPAFDSIIQGKFHLGITTSCREDWCLILTGPYSFSDYKDFPAANDGRERAHVTAVPLNWSVAGLLCTKQADCQ